MRLDPLAKISILKRLDGSDRKNGAHKTQN